MTVVMIVWEHQYINYYEEGLYEFIDGEGGGEQQVLELKKRDVKLWEAVAILKVYCMCFTDMTISHVKPPEHLRWMDYE